MKKLGHSSDQKYLPTVHPGRSLRHRIVTRIAVSRLGISVVRVVGRRLDPTLLRLSRGRLSVVYPFRVVLLTHTGAKSGIHRTSPVVYFTDRDRVILIVTAFGSKRNPAWYYNIKANPEVTLYGHGIAGRFSAVEVKGDERERLFNLATSADTPYADYERLAERYIPVIALHRTPESVDAS